MMAGVGVLSMVEEAKMMACSCQYSGGKIACWDSLFASDAIFCADSNALSCSFNNATTVSCNTDTKVAKPAIHSCIDSVQKACWVTVDLSKQSLCSSVSSQWSPNTDCRNNLGVYQLIAIPSSPTAPAVATPPAKTGDANTGAVSGATTNGYANAPATSDKLGSSGLASFIPNCSANSSLSKECRDVSVFVVTLIGITRYLFGVVGSIFLLLMVYGGIVWITSQGNSEKLKKGLDIFVAAMVGVAIIFSAYMLVNYLAAALEVSL